MDKDLRSSLLQRAYQHGLSYRRSGLARVIARKYGEQSFKAGEKANLGEEMADILWVLICLANQTGIDLTKELEKSIEKKTKRDGTRHKNNEKLS